MIDVGSIYQFNRRKAYVVRIADGFVHWHDLATKQTIRKVALWYFKKYACAAG